jgi:hypothetical protein
MLAMGRAMDGSAVEVWEGGLERWLEPFLARLRRKAQQRWAPFYLKGLILPGERKRVEPYGGRKGRRYKRRSAELRLARSSPAQPGRLAWGGRVRTRRGALA